ncbi:MAG: hypothetical protein AAB649_00010, partial [Patescibacteria group bacterium]
VLIIQKYGANDEVVTLLSQHMYALLAPLRMETNFYGLIPMHNVKAVFHALFLGSGYRFSEQDSNILFSEWIDAYNALTYS